ncbi:MAG: polysaccharide pyruvyl transferase family protein [Ruminococcus sp.]|nr:polysaccharide pyruvyl transferase family protein [Ruminococcus sp.]
MKENNMKIGIFTHYYLSDNYGGNLQAYALCIVLQQLGYTAEQICYIRNMTSKDSFYKKCILFLRHRIKKYIVRFTNKDFYKNVESRKKAIIEFNRNVVPHSDSIYDESTLYNLNDLYDCFITGSDQVWHPNVLCSGYLLEFCNDSSKKLSYAASIASSDLDIKSKSRLKKALESFSFISVREKDSVQLLSDIGIKNCKWVLDPTLLLNSHEWRRISKPLVIEKEYVLTYFLGDNEVSRRKAAEYAKKNNLQLVSLPYLLNQYRKCDKDFGDVKLFSVSPEQLLYLIDHADCVFTDSFHATVFSLIFQKNFYVFKRNESDKMTNRIQSLLKMFGFQERFIIGDADSNEIFEDTIRYTSSDEFESIKEQSYNYLDNALKILAEKHEK